MNLKIPLQACLKMYNDNSMLPPSLTSLHINMQTVFFFNSKVIQESSTVSLKWHHHISKQYVEFFTTFTTLYDVCTLEYFSTKVIHTVTKYSSTWICGFNHVCVHDVECYFSSMLDIWHTVITCRRNAENWGDGWIKSVYVLFLQYIIQAWCKFQFFCLLQFTELYIKYT